MNAVKMAAVNPRSKQLPSLYDRWLLLAMIGLIALGLLMVASSSIAVSYHLYHSPFHYVIRQGIYLCAGLALGTIISKVPSYYWYKISPWLILVNFALLILVLVPGFGRQINGSTRWLGFGGIDLQISELVKLTVIIYMAGYLVRHTAEVREKMIGFIKPMIMLVMTAFLLLKEPDFGASVVIMITSLGMMFLAGVRLSQFVGLLISVAIGLAAVAISSPYRMQRLTTFLNPWEHAFQSGYQLTQSLIAFGRGGLYGVGLGESIQKLFYLPESHTDFIFAVIAEELGFIGVFIVLALFTILVYRALKIGRWAQALGEYFAAYVAYGIGLWIALQVLINVGVSTGVLPTKGLTLPLISYGGSSLLVMCLTMFILFRIDHEVRLKSYGFSQGMRRGNE